MREGWKETTLGELCNIELGRTPARSSAKYWDKDRETENVWLSIADLPKDDINPVVCDSNEYLSDEGAKSGKLVEEGTLLVSFKLSLGRLAFAGRNLFTNEAIAALTWKVPESTLDQRFLFWYLRFFDWDEAASGDIKIKGKTLNKAKLKVLPVVLPPLAEQKRIVSILDEAFGAIDRAKRIAETNVANARELFESYLNRVFTAKGEGWEETTLGDICDFQNGYAFKSKWYTDHGIRLLRNVNVSHGFADWSSDVVRLPEEQANDFCRFSLNEGDVVLSLDRPVISTGLKAAILRTSDIPSLLLQRVLRITSKRLSQEYIFHWLFSIHFLAAIDPGRSLGVPHISAKEVGSVAISFPSSIPDQNQIVERVATAKESTRALERLITQKLAALDELKQSILQKAFTGQLTAKSPELEAVP